MKRLFCILTAALLFLSGCAAHAQTVDQMAGIEVREVSNWKIYEEDAVAVADFALRLFRQSGQAGKNTLISPFSVLAALGMTANGAAGSTLAEMETTFGMERINVNNLFYHYRALTAEGPLKLANAVWYNGASGFEPKQAFLQANADYYGAGAYRAPFDESTRSQINDWVKTHTDGMIPEILDEITDDAAMYLVNALAFQAKWRYPFVKDATKKGTFTREDGVEQTVDFMHGSGDYYLENDKATGFIKFYADTEYDFVALLPKEGVTVADLVASLDGKTFREWMKNRIAVDSVTVACPRFKCEFSADLAGALADMGMPEAFSERADFTAIGSVTQGDLYISRVLHKTYIEVDEAGTKAAAATAVETMYGGGIVEHREVRLDRPFLYLIRHNGVPLFFGALMDAQ